MSQKRNPPDGGQQSDCAYHFTTSEPSLERQAQQRAQQRRKAGGNGEIPGDRLFMLFRKLARPHLDDQQTLDKLIAEFADTHKRSMEDVCQWVVDLKEEARPPTEKTAEQDGNEANWESLLNSSPGPTPQGAKAHSAGGKSNPPQGASGLITLAYRKLSDVRARQTEWLWYPYIPRRANTIATGDSDVGKSKSFASIVSIATRGTRYPGTAVDVEPGNVIILSAEEDPESMLKPSLLAAGADCDRVYIVESCAEYDSQGRMRRRLVTMEKDIEGLITLGREIGNLSLTIIDPVTAYLGTKISGNDNTAIRSVLSGLQDFAETLGHANLLATHFGKDNTRSAKLQVLGSVAFVAGVRSVVGIFRDPQDDTGTRRLMVPVKCNLVPECDRFGIAFEIHGVDVRDGDTELTNIGAVNWIPGRVTRTADEIIAEQRVFKEQADNDMKKTSAARQRIVDVLRAAERPLSARRIAEILEGEDIPKSDDPRRVRVRRLLTKMLQSNQIDQDENELYTLSYGDLDSSSFYGEEIPL